MSFLNCLSCFTKISSQEKQAQGEEPFSIIAAGILLPPTLLLACSRWTDQFFRAYPQHGRSSLHGPAKVQRRTAMRPFAIALVLATISASCCTIATAQKAQQVHGEGCVEPGAESRCLVVKD